MLLNSRGHKRPQKSTLQSTDGAIYTMDSHNTFYEMNTDNEFSVLKTAF